MVRRVVKLLLPLLIFFARGLCADPLADAARALAARIAPHLEAGETAHVTARNLSSLPAADVEKARTEFVTALRRRGQIRVVVEVALAVSENVKGFLLVAQVRDAVETVEFQPDPQAAGPALITITRRLLREQNEPILDVSEQGNRIFVLHTDKVAVWERDTGRLVETAEISAPPVRDPRGRLVIADNALEAYLPGATCRGSLQPLTLSCDNSTGDFPDEGTMVHFTPGRNTISPVVRDDMVTMCPGKVLVAERDDALVLRKGDTQISETVELGGVVTALWQAALSPGGGGALAVARNSKTRQYAAYLLSVDCGR
jgi:hypothetical protein